jgi:hypothetical protein
MVSSCRTSNRLSEIGAPFIAFGGMYGEDAEFAYVDVKTSNTSMAETCAMRPLDNTNNDDDSSIIDCTVTAEQQAGSATSTVISVVSRDSGILFFSNRGDKIAYYCLIQV